MSHNKAKQNKKAEQHKKAKQNNRAKQNNKAKQSMLRSNVLSEAKRSAKQHIGLDVIEGKPPKAAFKSTPQHMLAI